MERYRVNYWLLGTLAIGACLLGGAVYGIWSFQMNRNADRFKEESEQALEAGDIEGAAAALSQYLAFDPADRDAAVELASLRVKLADQAVEQQEWSNYAKYMQSVENVLSRHVDAEQLRRDAVELYRTLHQRTNYAAAINEALTHLDILLESPENAGESELRKQRATCLFLLRKDDEAIEALSELVGFDPVTGQFSEEEALATDDAEIYFFLAQLLLQDEESAQAELVIETLVQRNPESGDAYLRRGRFLPLLAAAERNQERADALREKAKEDARRAYELDPEDEVISLFFIDSILRQADEVLRERLELIDEIGDETLAEDDPKVQELNAQVDELTKRANELADAGIDKHPESTGFYRTKARIAAFDKDVDTALQELDRGIEAIDDESVIALELFKIEMLLRQQKIDEASELLAVVRKRELASRVGIRAQLDIAEARIKHTNGQWFEAKDLLERVRADMPAISQQQRHELANVDFLLGLAHEKLGARDLAVKAYRRSLQNHPGNMMAQAGVDRMEIRRIGEARTGSPTAMLLVDELKKPVDERDWNAVLAKLDDSAASEGLSEVQTSLIRAELLGRSGDYEAARQQIDNLFKENPDNLQVWRSAIQLVATDPERGPLEALKLLDVASDEDHFGDLPVLRLQRARVLIAINNENLDRQLLALTEGIDDWDTQQKVQLWRGIGQQFLLMRNADAAEQAYSEVAKIAPGDLQTRVMLFRLALERSDDEAMEQAQQEILSVVGDKSNPTWMYSEAARLFSRYRRELEEDSALEQVRTLLQKAIEERSEWSDPYLLLGDLALVEKDQEKAIENLGKGLTLGARNPVAALNYIKMLTQRGRFFQARDAVESFDPDLRQRVLGRSYAEILLRTNSPAEAFDSAVEVVQGNPNNAATQLWFGRFMQRLAASTSASDVLKQQASEKAGAALAKVVELLPGSQEGWLGYISYLRTSVGIEATEEAMRKAQLALPEDAQLGIMARSYEVVGRWFDAENLYRANYENNPDEVRFARALAEFYLGPIYRREDKLQKASELINAVLRKVADGEIAKDDTHAQWARRRAARILAATRDYQNLLKAENLLSSNTVDGRLSVEDKLEMARILAPRPEPISRRKAIALLEDVKPYQDLPLETDLTLATLYFQDGNWPKCREMMTRITSTYPDVADVRRRYIKMLLQRGGRTELTIASRQLNRLVDLAPDAPTTLELIVLVADRSGEEAKAQATLRRIVSNLNNMNREQYPFALRVAQLLTELGDIEGARKIYEELARREPDDARFQLELAGFVGRNGKPDDGFQLLDDLQGKAPTAGLIQVGSSIVRADRDTIGDKYDGKILGWIERELRDEPESIPLLLQKGEFFDLIERADEAAAVYRQLLKNPSLTGRNRAVVLNNLAYLLVLGAADESASGEAAKLVAEAVSILGPSTDILDTRGVLEISRGNYQDAVEDLEMAVIDNPTAAKYFHKTQAHLGAGQNRLAIESWDKAVELGLDADQVAALEMAAYEDTVAKIEQLKARTGDL